jgi:hypothetical protein
VRPRSWVSALGVLARVAGVVVHLCLFVAARSCQCCWRPTRRPQAIERGWACVPGLQRRTSHKLHVSRRALLAGCCGVLVVYLHNTLRRVLFECETPFSCARERRCVFRARVSWRVVACVIASVCDSVVPAALLARASCPACCVSTRASACLRRMAGASNSRPLHAAAAGAELPSLPAP